MLTQARLRELLDYNPTTGLFTRLVQRRGPRSHVGAVAGCDNGQGYIRIYVDGKGYKAHRLAWLWMTGEWPPADIDHDGLNRSDNRWKTLRAATRSQNCANRRAFKNSASQIKGVSFNRRAARWVAQIQVRGRKIGLGYFDDPAEAAAAYASAARKYHGEFARTE